MHILAKDSLDLARQSTMVVKNVSHMTLATLSSLLSQDPAPSQLESHTSQRSLCWRLSSEASQTSNGLLDSRSFQRRRHPSPVLEQKPPTMLILMLVS